MKRTLGLVLLVVTLMPTLAWGDCLSSVGPGAVMTRTGLQKINYQRCHWENEYNPSIQLLEDKAMFMQGSGTTVPGSCTHFANFFTRTGGVGDPSLWWCNGSTYVLIGCAGGGGGTTTSTTATTTSTTTGTAATTTTTTVTTSTTTTTAPPIVCSTLTQGKVIGGSNLTFTTASISPAANRLELAAIINNRPSGDCFGGPLTVTGNGLTWVQVDAWGNSFFYCISVFRAMGASPSTGAVTFDFTATAQQNAAWAVIECTGIDTGGTNGSAAVLQAGHHNNGTATSGLVSLSAFSNVNNQPFGAWFLNSDATSTQVNPGSGFTELAEQGDTTAGVDLEVEYGAPNDTTVDASWASSRVFAGIAFELKVP